MCRRSVSTLVGQAAWVLGVLRIPWRCKDKQRGASVDPAPAVAEELETESVFLYHSLQIDGFYSYRKQFRVKVVPFPSALLGAGSGWTDRPQILLLRLLSQSEVIHSVSFSFC